MPKYFFRFLLLLLIIFSSLAVLGLIGSGLRLDRGAPLEENSASSHLSDVDQALVDLASKHGNTAISFERFTVLRSEASGEIDKQDSFSLIYPAGRRIYQPDSRDYLGNVSEGAALCPEVGCQDSELAVRSLPGQDLSSWLFQEKEGFSRTYWWNVPEKYSVTMLPNMDFMGTPGVGLRIQCQDPSCMDNYSTDVVMAAIQTDEGVLEVRFNPSNQVHLDIIGSLTW